MGCAAAAEQTGNISQDRGSEAGLTITISAGRTGGTWASKYRGGVFSKELGDHFVPRGRGKKYAKAYGLAHEITAHRASDFGSQHKSYKKEYGGDDIRHWDIAPGKEYFSELARVSKNQIIWGGNYFDLPPTRCFLIWRKLSIGENFTMAMAEYAWTSFNDNAKVFEHVPQGDKNDERFHPTQKPVALYEWIYKLYAKKGDKILDTHMGSGSSRIAAYHMGLDYVGCEIDKMYFDLQEKRFAKVQDEYALFGESGEQLCFDFR